jgi:HEPN domain-containing protein
MGFDWEKEAEVGAWLSKANEDLRAADAAMKADPPVLGVALFLAQQAAEKSMKAFLTWHDQSFRKTHNLVEIGEQCVAIDPSLEPLFRKAARLSEYAWKFRYPGEPAEPIRDEAEKAIDLAREVRSAILSRTK